MNPKEHIHKVTRGWFPQELALKGIKTSNIAADKDKAERHWKAFKIVAVADGITVGIFSGTHNLIDSYSKSIEITILSWSIFVIALIAENVLIYRHYKQLMLPKRWFKR